VGPDRHRRHARLLICALAPVLTVLTIQLLCGPAIPPAAARSAGAELAAAGPTGGSAFTGAPLTGGSDVASARSEADAAARRVDALRVRYQQLSARAAAEGGRLAAAFGAQSLVSGQHDADAAALAHAASVRAASVRAVYADGGELGLLGSVLAARSADDALWRLGTARRIEAGLLRGLQGQETAAAGAEARSRQAEDAAADADAALAQELAAFQDDVAAADATLNQAEAELSRLTANARRLLAAQEAAQRLAAARAAAQAARLAPTEVSALVIPPEYLSAYHDAAATCPGLDWSLLAAVGQVESGHGRNNGPSSAGAIGPMQFMPATFDLYAVDGDHDGVTDPWNYRDAIFTAAAYLCASGARDATPDGIRAALFAYNHAQWYVDLVLSAQRAILAAN
jgi:Transglycosylase SLT domain